MPNHDVSLNCGNTAGVLEAKLIKEILDTDGFSLVLINNVNSVPADTFAYMLGHSTDYFSNNKLFSSVSASAAGDAIIINGTSIPYTKTADPADLSEVAVGSQLINTVASYDTAVRNQSFVAGSGQVSKVFNCCYGVSTDYSIIMNVVNLVNTDPYMNGNTFKYFEVPSPYLTAAAYFLYFLDKSFTVSSFTYSCLENNRTGISMDKVSSSDIKQQVVNGRSIYNIINNYDKNMRNIGRIIPNLNGQSIGSLYTIPAQKCGKIFLDIMLRNDLDDFERFLGAIKSMATEYFGYSEDQWMVPLDFTNSKYYAAIDTQYIYQGTKNNEVCVMLSYDPIEAYAKHTIDLIKTLG